MTPFRWSLSGQNYIIRRNVKKLVASISSSMKSFKWLLISWLKERYVCTDLLRLCTKRHYSGDLECELETLSRMTIRPTVDDDFCFSLTSFFHCSKSNEEEDFRKATQLYENTVGVTADTRHIELKGEPKVKHHKWLTCNFAGCQFRGIGLAVRKERCFSGVLFRGLPLWISLVSRGFQCLPWAEK